MSLRTGDRLGPYEILGAIGAGGMGEVYRGRDTRLDRTVAIKVLPDAVAQDPERLARFEREAKTLAALNHPQIAQIYGLEGSALAMEFVEGEDLSSRIARGPMPVDDALEIAADIARALEAAHEIGIVHRDLKASNIRLRQDGAVKVLDFGLAKALAPAVDTFSAESRPTITTPAMTSQGVILGTAAYMSPEQARGKPVDKRADIWAFGVVLYEMVTGRPPFEGETVQESLAAVMKSEPDWTAVPVQLHRLLRSCLEKDPRKRLRDIGDWRRQLDEPAAAKNLAVKKTWLPWTVAAGLAIGAGILVLSRFLETTPAAPPIAFQIPPPAKNTFEILIAVSPDGRRVAFTAKDADNVDRVWVRGFGSLESRPVAGTEGARNVAWSPDGRSVVFAVGRSLRRTAVDGGPPLTIYEAESVESLGGAAWSPTGVLVVGGFRAGALRLVPEAGGAVRPLTSVDYSRQELAHGIPSFLPDGRHFLYLRVASDPNVSGLFVGSINRKPEEQDRTRLLASSHAMYAPADGALGALLYLRQATLVAHPFDPDRLAFVGEPVPIIEGVGNFGALGFFSAGAGVIAYRSGSRGSGIRESQLTWLDRSGKPTSVVGRLGSYDGISLSSDGTRAAVIQVGPSDTGLGNVDIWTIDLARGISQRLTSHDSSDRFPTWSPKGDQIVFHSMRSGSADLNIVSSTGGAEAGIFTSKAINAPTSWSSDGRFVLFHSFDPGKPADIWLLPLTGERKPIAIVQTPFAELDARFSPDMKWISYSSNASGRSEIYVRPFNAASPASSPSGAIIVSKDGGSLARWRRDGRELFFQTPDGKVAAVGLETSGGQVKPGVPVVLFTLPWLTYWDVTGDGQRFLVTMPPAEGGLAPINVLLNWSLR